MRDVELAWLQAWRAAADQHDEGVRPTYSGLQRSPDGMVCQTRDSMRD